MLAFSSSTRNDTHPGRYDAFDRMRVSEPVTLFEDNPIFDKSPSVWDETLTGGATSTHNANSYISMVVSGAGDSVIRQTYEYVDYQPGKSKLSLFTGVLNRTPTAGVVCRMGQYDDFNNKTVVAGGGNGHFFEMDGTTINIVQRTGLSGSVGPGNYDTRVPQINWNIDRLDGTGPSTLVWDANDFANDRLFVIDLQWLGIGRVRMGIYIAGHIHYLHEFYNTQYAEPYNRMEKLPIRYEISSTSGAGEMRQVCSTVLSEGGYIPLGVNWYHNTTAAVKIPRLAIRLKDAYNRMTVFPTVVSMLPQGGNTEFDWVMVRVPLADVTGGSWVSSGSVSAVEVNTTTTSVSFANEVKIHSGLGATRTENRFSVGNSKTPLVSQMDGTSFVLLVSCSVNCAISLGWLEIR
jgi:hypothetical protein